MTIWLLLVCIVLFGILLNLTERIKRLSRDYFNLYNLHYDLVDDVIEIEEFMSSPYGSVDVLAGKITRSTEDAACWDIYSAVDTTILPRESVVVPTGLRTQMTGVDALLFDRSGLAAKFRVTRRAGVIDAKYPDEWGVVLVNEGRYEYKIKKGDRIAQALFLPKFDVVLTARNDAVIETTDTARTGGFGSTGK